MRPIIAVVVAILLLCVPSGIGLAAGTCGQTPTLGTRAAGEPSLTGEYVNRNYCYRMRVPEGLAAYGDGVGGHGFGLSIPSEHPGYFYVDGSANSYDDNDSPEKAAALYVKWTKESGARIVGTETSPTVMGTLPAVRLIIRYRCTDSSPDLVDESVIALSPRKSVVYTLGLMTSEARYPQHRQVLENLLRTWQFLSPADNPRCPDY